LINIIHEEGAVKKAFFFFMSIVVLAPLLAGAVTWQMDSSPFSFPATSVFGGAHMIASPSAIKSSFDEARGIVSFSCNLPSRAEGAKLRVYNSNGVMVKAFELQTGTSSVQWNVSKNKVAAGVYLASLRYGDVENKIQISIVK
jgi:flagellar hook assembly protein FlgD